MTKKEEIRGLIKAIGIVPVVRASSPHQARFAAEAVLLGGIPIVEITMTVPRAIVVISELVRSSPEVLVGAGTVLDAEAARQCVDAGAQFIVTPGLDAATAEFAANSQVLLMMGALTPTEVITAWKAGADFVKLFPCGNLGGPNYIKALRGPLPHVPLVPTGGVCLDNAADYIRAGAAALGVGGELILKSALESCNSEPIRELAHRFVNAVKNARDQEIPKTGGTATERGRA